MTDQACDGVADRDANAVAALAHAEDVARDPDGELVTVVPHFDRGAL